MKKERKNTGDSELALLAANGDIEAFEELYDRHARGVAKTLASFAGTDPGMVDDLTQDVFFRVIKGLPTYVPSHPFSHWLYTIVLNVGRNHVRKKSKLVFLRSEDLDVFPAHRGGAHNPSRELLASMLMRRAARLPGHLLEVLSLRIGAAMTYGEIGETLGIPEGTARSRMHEALKLLRSEMGMDPSESGKERRNNEQRT